MDCRSLVRHSLGGIRPGRFLLHAGHHERPGLLQRLDRIRAGRRVQEEALEELQKENEFHLFYCICIILNNIDYYDLKMYNIKHFLGGIL